MINVKELIDDLVATGMSKEDAIKEASATFKLKSERCKKENKKYALARAKTYNPKASRTEAYERGKGTRCNKPYSYR